MPDFFMIHCLDLERHRQRLICLCETQVRKALSSIIMQVGLLPHWYVWLIFVIAAIKVLGLYWYIQTKYHRCTWPCIVLTAYCFTFIYFFRCIIYLDLFNLKNSVSLFQMRSRELREWGAELFKTVRLGPYWKTNGPWLYLYVAGFYNRGSIVFLKMFALTDME